jgi:hypothetical protein
MSKFNRSIVLLFPIFSLCTNIYAAFPNIPDDQYQTLLKEFEANPTLLAEKPELIGSLSPDQLSNAVESLGFTHYSWLHPVSMRGREVPSLLGKKFSELSLMSVRAGKLIPVPLQMDDYDTKGWVYLEGKGKVDGVLGVLDENDEILFMYRDTGVEPYTPAIAGLDGTIVKELKFERNGSVRYAYLVQGSKQRNDADYVQYNFEDSVAETTFFGFDTQTDNFLMFEDFYAKVGDRQNTRILDAIYANVDTQILSKLSPHVRLNTIEHIKALPVGAVSGQVREAVIIKLGLVIAKVPVATVRAQMNIFDQALGFVAKVNIPGVDILTRFLVEPHIYVSLDFVDEQGARVNSAISSEPDGHAIVDGRLSEFEQQMQVDVDNPWLWLSSTHGWDVFAKVNVPEDFRVGVNMLYIDDPTYTTAFENFPGAHPTVGFDIHNIPKDFTELVIDALFVFPDRLGMGPRQFHDTEYSVPPTLEIRNLVVETPAEPASSLSNLAY